MFNLEERYNWTDEEVYAYNRQVECADNVDSYVCTRCKGMTCRDDSYSNKWKDLHCSDCVTKLAKELNITRMMYLHQHVWKDVI